MPRSSESRTLPSRLAGTSEFELDVGAYNEILLDMDGVLIDSNAIKARNIEQAALFKGQAFARRFAADFVAGSGIPRETKIAQWFSDDEASEVLATYNRLNAETLHQAEVLPGVAAFLDHLRALSVSISVFTGGLRAEAVQMLAEKGMLDYFVDVYGGPLTKEENFSRRDHLAPIVMFGDSRVDYEFAQSCGLDFVFVAGATHFLGWREFFAGQESSHRRIVAIISDFRDVNVQKRPLRKAL
jgi:phosphoglycolate phosphatase-like HAD superfamily hydrolase